VAPILLIFLRAIAHHSSSPKLKAFSTSAMRAKIWPLSRRPIVYTAHEAEKKSD